MKRHLPVFVLLLFIFGGCTPQQSEVQDIAVAKTIEIGVRNIAQPDAQTQLTETPELLAISSGYEDELPDGPASFDILPDGQIVIADPLQSRLVVYSGNGEYQSQRMLGFAATRVRATGTAGEVLVDRRGTLDAYLSSNTGDPVPASVNIASFDTNGEAKLIDRNTGSVTPEGKAPIQVAFKNDSLFLVSIQNLGTMSGSTFVLLETSNGQVPIAIHRFLRVYDDSGAWISEIVGFAEDHQVFPEDEFRLHGNRVYQMSPGKEKLHIHIWNIAE